MTADRLDQAHIRAAQTLNHLQSANAGSSALEHHALLPLIQRAAELDRDILALSCAIRESK